MTQAGREIQSAGMKRAGQVVAPKRGMRSSWQRLRRGLSRFFFATPAESSGNYPGFFVLPRAGAHSHPSEARQPKLRRWVARFKLLGVLLLVIGGFVGMLAYFFYHVTTMVSSPYSDPIPFVSDPKALPTNSTVGLGRP